jgi:hypothetical protein
MIAFARNGAADDAERTACRRHELPPPARIAPTLPQKIANE